MAEQVGKFLTELPELTSPSDSNLMYVVDGETSKKATLGNLKKIVGGDVTGAGSGAVVSFSDGADDVPLEALSVGIKPIQDLHGYSKPWAGGAGKNKYPILISADTFYTNNGGSYTSSDGVVTVTTSVNDAQNTGIYSPASGQIMTTRGTISYPCTISFKAKSADGARLRYGTSSSSSYQVLTSSWQTFSYTISSSNNDPCIWYISNSVSGQKIDIKDLMIEEGSSASTYEPYSNVCPITPRTQVNVTVSATEGGSGETTTVALNRNVYGGVLNVKTGQLSVTHGSVTLDGSVSVTSVTDLGTNVRFWSYLGTGFKTAPTQDEAISNYIPCSPATGTYASDVSEFRPFSTDYPSSGWLKLPKSLVGTTDTSINAYLTSNPLTIVSPLATPQTYTLTPTEVRTILGANNISADSGDVDLVYVRDLNIVINDLIDRVTALENE